MNSVIKLALIVGVTYFAVDTMRNGWAGGEEVPKSMRAMVREAKVLDRKLVVLITGSDWCPACKSMEQSMLRTAEWQRFASEKIVFRKFEYPNGGEATTAVHQDLLQLPGFKGFPTMVVVNSSGRILDMRAGYGGGSGEYVSWIKSL